MAQQIMIKYDFYYKNLKFYQLRESQLIANIITVQCNYTTWTEAYYKAINSIDLELKIVRAKIKEIEIKIENL